MKDDHLSYVLCLVEAQCYRKTAWFQQLAEGGCGLFIIVARFVCDLGILFCVWLRMAVDPQIVEQPSGNR